MPTISLSTSVAGNARSGNVLAGQLFEFVQGFSAIQLLAVAAADGIDADFTVGGTQIVSAGRVSDANRFPVAPDDLLSEIGASPNERLFLDYLNTTGGAIIVRTKVNIDPL